MPGLMWGFHHRQRRRQEIEIRRAKTGFLARRHRHIEKRQQIAQDGSIGPPAQVDRQMCAQIASVQFPDRNEQRPLARAIHVDQRPINVPSKSESRMKKHGTGDEPNY